MSYVIERSKDRKTWKPTGYAYGGQGDVDSALAWLKQVEPKYSYRIVTPRAKKSPSRLRDDVFEAAMRVWRARKGGGIDEYLLRALDSACSAAFHASRTAGK